MPERCSFQYAVIRVVPQVEREEFINAGVILHCPERGYLGIRLDLQLARLPALAPGANRDRIAGQLRGMAAIAAGEAEAGEFAGWTKSERFHWLVAPSSTVIQPSPVHPGVTEDPAGTLEELYARLVA